MRGPRAAGGARAYGSGCSWHPAPHAKLFWSIIVPADGTSAAYTDERASLCSDKCVRDSL
jgi:hypothetical protein